MPDHQRLRAAYLKAREGLLARRTPSGHWEGELSSSALSTATAVSALSIASQYAPPAERDSFRSLIDAGLRWVLDRQNDDGGWGDTDRSRSNISTAMLVRAALHLANREHQHAGALSRAETYIESQGGIAGLRKRYGRDKTFAVPILTNCALAKLVAWREVAPLPFELACLPQSWYRFAKLPVVSYAIPALVAIGQARYFHKKPWNPIARFVRALSVRRSLAVLEKMQPASGGFLEATPLTSFVVMSLASIGRHDHPVTRSGLKFIAESVRADGSWPIDTNLATWVTTLALNALGKETSGDDYLSVELIEWLLRCQHTQRHPFTGADPGGWGWSDLSGAVPDADDTPGALLALDGALLSCAERPDARRRPHTRSLLDKSEEILAACRMGRTWLCGLQNRDGGWPTFCRGWGKLPFDRSGTDLTAHALRVAKTDYEFPADQLERGFRFLARNQRADGSWLPLWFGNENWPNDENPLYGTARVLLAYRDLDRMNDDPAQRAVRYLVSQQNRDGGWGGGANGECRVPRAVPHSPLPIPNSPIEINQPRLMQSSVEETAVVVEALLAAGKMPATQTAVERGVVWLVESIEAGRFRSPSPIGFYFAKLWYYESLYPIIFTVSALRRAVEAYCEPEPK